MRVATILWDRTRDEFQLGQWLQGRIYERRCDLSPDGKHLIYFAMNGKWNSEAHGAWTAISRAPYLKALAIFPKGDCWHGGGLWTGNSTYWLNDALGHSVLQNTKVVRRDRWHRLSDDFGSECPGVYYHRLLRDGWTFIRPERIARWKDRNVFEKPISQGWCLRKIAHTEVGTPVGHGCYWDEHELVQVKSDSCIPCPNWGWADLDGNRLVCATDGKLKCAQVGNSGPTDETELFDFSEMTFTRIKALY